MIGDSVWVSFAVILHHDLNQFVEERVQLVLELSVHIPSLKTRNGQELMAGTKTETIKNTVLGACFACFLMYLSTISPGCYYPQ